MNLKWGSETWSSQLFVCTQLQCLISGWKCYSNMIIGVLCNIGQSLWAADRIMGIMTNFHQRHIYVLWRADYKWQIGTFLILGMYWNGREIHTPSGLGLNINTLEIKWQRRNVERKEAHSWLPVWLVLCANFEHQYVVGPQISYCLSNIIWCRKLLMLFGVGMCGYCIRNTMLGYLL